MAFNRDQTSRRVCRVSVQVVTRPVVAPCRPRIGVTGSVLGISETRPSIQYLT